MILLLSLLFANASAHATDFVYPIVIENKWTGKASAGSAVSISKNKNLYLISRHIWANHKDNSFVINPDEKLVYCSSQVNHDYCLIRSPQSKANSYGKFSVSELLPQSELELYGNGLNRGVRSLKGKISSSSSNLDFVHCIQSQEGDSGGAILNSDGDIAAINIGLKENSADCPGSSLSGSGVSASVIQDEIKNFHSELLDEIEFKN